MLKFKSKAFMFSLHDAARAAFFRLLRLSASTDQKIGAGAAVNNCGSKWNWFRNTCVKHAWIYSLQTWMRPPSMVMSGWAGSCAIKWELNGPCSRQQMTMEPCSSGQHDTSFLLDRRPATEQLSYVYLWSPLQKIIYLQKNAVML